MKIYGTFVSPPSRFLFGMCKNLGIEYEEQTIDIMKREQYEESYSQINPNSKVPCIVEEDGFTLFETAAIARYLIDTKVGENKLYPKDHKNRAIVDKAMNEIIEFRNPGVVIMLGKMVFPKLGKTYPPMLLEKAEQAFSSVMQNYNDKFETEKYLCGGESATIADLLFAEYLIHCQFMKINLEESYPNCAKYLQNLMVDFPYIKEDNEKVAQIIASRV